MSNGRFITFEGGEGAGKSTQIARLSDRLRDLGRDVVTTREPGGTAFAETVRRLILDPATPRHGPLAEALLFSAARSDHVTNRIAPALSQGKWVLCDRFADSTRAYQGAAGGVDPALLLQLEDIAVADTRPDLTLILDIDPAEGLARASARQAATTAVSADPYETRDIAFHERLREAFAQIARDEPGRCIIIDASGEADAVESRIWASVLSRCAVEPG